MSSIQGKLDQVGRLCYCSPMQRKRETINIAEAKARLPELIERVAGGEEIILSRNGKPRARLVPLEEKKKYVFGAGKGKWEFIGDFDAPLPDDVIATFYESDIFPIEKKKR